MIVVDTSALVAILLNEPEATACMKCLRAGDTLLMSAGTLAEALVVATRLRTTDQMLRLIEGLAIEIVTVTSASSRRIGDAYKVFGKGMHPAALNFGDCFAYELAKQRNCPLLFIGNDFRQTDIVSAL